MVFTETRKPCPRLLMVFVNKRYVLWSSRRRTFFFTHFLLIIKIILFVNFNFLTIFKQCFGNCRLSLVKLRIEFKHLFKIITRRQYGTKQHREQTEITFENYSHKQKIILLSKLCGRQNSRTFREHRRRAELMPSISKALWSALNKVAQSGAGKAGGCPANRR